MKIAIYPDHESLVRGAADFIAGQACLAIRKRGRFTVALAGGDTPRPIYSRLAAAAYRNRIDWPRVLVFFGDERCVPPDDPRSNYLMARTALLDRVPLPAGNIHRIRGEDDPQRAAANYARVLKQVLGGDAAAGGPPPEGFDLVLLGLGDDGHTASLFPGLAAVAETKRWVMAQYVETAGNWRVTLTPVIINAARQVAFLVSGAKKAEMVRRVLEGPYQPAVLPAQSVRPTQGELHWLMDMAAAARLARRS